MGHLEKKTHTKAEIYNQPATTDLKHGPFAHILLFSSFFNRSELESKTINYTYPYVQLNDLYEYVMFVIVNKFILNKKRKKKTSLRVLCQARHEPVCTAT